MSVKDEILAQLIQEDRSGQLRHVHEQLVKIGLSFRGSRNSGTLPYFFKSKGRTYDLAAIRVPDKSIFSFPVSFWGTRQAALGAILSGFSNTERVPLVGPISSSQYSAGQIAITENTAPRILETIGRDLNQLKDGVLRG